MNEKLGDIVTDKRCNILINGQQQMATESLGSIFGNAAKRNAPSIVEIWPTFEAIFIKPANEYGNNHPLLQS